MLLFENILCTIDLLLKSGIEMLKRYDFFCRLFEAYLPRFFQGATQMFRNRAKRDGDGNPIEEYKENVTNHPDVSEDAKKILREHVHFSREIEFYEFARQRFYKQVNSVLS